MISSLMEQFPEKIAVAVFVSARMLHSGDDAEETSSKVAVPFAKPPLFLIGCAQSLLKLFSSAHVGLCSSTREDEPCEDFR